MSADIFAILPKDKVLTPADGKPYEDVLIRWADNSLRRAKYVVLPESAEDVSKAIRFATANNLEIAIRGGGHSTSGASSSEDLVIDLRRLNKVVVDTSTQLLTVGGGAVWKTVDKEAAKHGLATVGGTVNHTGVGGLTVGGGYGWLTSKYGLTIDNLVQAELVLANGDIVICSESQNSDLFWAIRGAGSNFGPVTSFVFKAYPQTNPVWSGLLVFPPPTLPAIIDATKQWAKQAGENESAMVIFASPPPTFQPAIIVLPFYNGSAEEGKKKFDLFYKVGPVADMTREMPYDELNSLQNPIATYGDRKSLKGAPLTSIEASVIAPLFENYTKFVGNYPDAKGSAILIELHPFQKIVAVPEDATAFANRGPYYSVTFTLRWKDPSLDTKLREWATAQTQAVRSADEKLSGHSLAGTRGYANYGLGDERVRDVFGANYERLSQLKAKYDPTLVFKKWYPITPKA